MGLDLALGVFILVGAVRGWRRGFMLQATRLAALIGCVYLADPIRDLARPTVQSYLPGIQLPLLDRLLWWAGAVLAFVVTAGLGSWIVKAYRRRPYGDIEPNRTDQGAGFCFGAAKALVIASFLVAAVSRFGPAYLKNMGEWAVQQARTSQAMTWSNQYKPAERIWNALPVQHFVAHVKSRGLLPSEAKEESKDASAAPVQTASRPKTMELPPAGVPADPEKALAEIDAELRRLQEGLVEKPGKDKAR
jgi:uncharacterized membrane protein required for colicin V production